MRIDRTHLPWAFVFVCATAVAAVFYVATFHRALLPFPFELPRVLEQAPSERSTVGGSTLGLIFGTIAALIFLFSSALGIRKKKRLWRIGNVQMWLRAHLWLSFFTIPLICFHSGFNMGGPHTSWLMVIYSMVMGSGFFGVAMQHFLPRVMKERLSAEVVYEQIPHLRELIFEEALKLRSEVREIEREVKGRVAAVEGIPQLESAEDTSAQIIGDFLDEECLPYLRAGRRRARRRQLGDRRTSDDLFRLLKVNSSEKLRARVEDMQQWCNDRRNMDLQVRLHHWLHGWLFLHVPLSFALLVMTAWHIYIALLFR
jgi:hypothetical protein